MQESFNTLHLLSMYALHPGKQVWNRTPKDEQPNNNSEMCVLCQGSHVETHAHLFLECEKAKVIWKEASKDKYSSPSSMRKFVCLANCGTLETRAGWLQTPKKLPKRQEPRWSHARTLVFSTG